MFKLTFVCTSILSFYLFVSVCMVSVEVCLKQPTYGHVENNFGESLFSFNLLHGFYGSNTGHQDFKASASTH